MFSTMWADKIARASSRTFFRPRAWNTNRSPSPVRLSSRRKGTENGGTGRTGVVDEVAYGVRSEWVFEH